MSQAEKPVHLEGGAALEEFVSDHDVALVEFYTSGCPKCGAMEPVLGNVARASDVAVGMVNPADDPRLLEAYPVRSVPALLVFREGEEAARKVEGFQGVSDVLEFLEEHAPGVVDRA